MPPRHKKPVRRKRGKNRKLPVRGRRPANRGGAAMKVRVRMYRQGLGDCFLVTFDPSGNEKHMMIDCGTLGASTTGVKLAQVAADIRTTTGDHLDLLIGTHEHWDHVSGFDSLKDEFAKIQVDNVWLAWTENPEDELAKQLAKDQRDLGSALRLTSRALAAAGNGASQSIGDAVRDLLGFFNAEDPLGAASKFKESLDAAMQFVRKRPGAKVEYFKPGKLIEPDWLPGFRFYVLGPPYSESALNDLGEHGSSELYHITAGLRAAAAQSLSGLSATDHAAAIGDHTAQDAFERELPFDARFRFQKDDSRIQDAFQKTYFADAAAWRRVDADWLHLSADLALQLDNATNNTSLVLAIERITDGKVLLFPADAQEGSWVSWHDAAIQWNIPGNPDPVNAKSLLANTVFYKVGHHSSHNATAKGKGLELMKKEQELTAFIPVDRKVALGRHPQGSWKMPARPLYRRLLEKCRGRVVRSDIGWATPPDQATLPETEEAFEGMATAAEWATWQAEQQAKDGTQVVISKLHIDYILA